MTKKCTKCKEVKELSEFGKYSRSKDGLEPSCKLCKRKVKKAYYEVNKENIAARMKAYHRANKEKVATYNKAYYDANKEKAADRMKAWMKANPDKINAANAKRRASKLNATPDWLTDHQRRWIQWFYSQAKRLEELTGTKYHVDHIIPLQGGGVCGLHVPWNLQILTAEENLSKSNSYETEGTSWNVTKK